MGGLTYPPATTDPSLPHNKVYAELRETTQAMMPSGHRVWLVTRFDDARFVLSDERFSRYLLYPGAPCMIQPGDYSTGERSILNLDPPDHTRLRRLTAKAFTARRILEDVEIAGTTIRKGEAVMAVSGAANYDATEFADPDTFDITRTHNPHLGFGHGIHFCFGAPMARLEGQIALTALYRRFPDLRLAVAPDEVAWRPPLSVRGPASVPVTW